jgi:putative ABC transport system permease protein
MLFLVLTVSMGVFFANTARAINRNAEETVEYSVGCDAVLTENWESSKSESSSSSTSSAASYGSTAVATDSSDDSDDSDSETTVIYTEPVFERFENLTGVEAAAKVLREDGVKIESSKMNVVRTSTDTGKKTKDDFLNQSTATTVSNSSSNVQLMAIQPGEFSKVYNFEDRLLPVQLNNYLNALAEYTPGVILSSSFKDYGLSLGDTVQCSWGSNDSFEATVLAFVDYFPGLSPYEEDKNGDYMDFAIMNLDYVNVQTNIEPYQVWFKLKDGASVQDFYDSVDSADIDLISLTSAKEQIIEAKNDPILLGMNGALTLGFIIIMVMCIIGFLIYWIMSIKSRTLQFGILRAMGMKYREIIAMIVYEQLLVSGVAIFTAMYIGGITSNLFVPLFQTIFDSDGKSVPEFTVIPVRSDYLKLYAVIGFMLILGFIVLGRIISRINVSKALKLGED